MSERKEHSIDGASWREIQPFSSWKWSRPKIGEDDIDPDLPLNWPGGGCRVNYDSRNERTTMLVVAIGARLLAIAALSRQKRATV